MRFKFLYLKFSNCLTFDFKTLIMKIKRLDYVKILNFAIEFRGKI